MIDLIESKFSRAGFRKIGVNEPKMALWFRVVNGICYVVNLVDYQDPVQSGVTTEIIESVTDSVHRFLQSKGYNDIQVLTLIITYSEYVAEDLAGDRVLYWVLDTYHTLFIQPAGQPDSFGGFEGVMRDVIDTLTADIFRQENTVQGYVPQQHKKKKQIRILTMNNLLILINVLVFVRLEMQGSTENTLYMLMHGAFYWPLIKESGELYRFFTCIFIHFGFMHLAGNMITLFYLGDNLERAVGVVKYIIIYVVTGLASSVVSCLYYIIIGKDVVSGGASGAVFGVIGALVYIVTVNKGKLEDLNSVSLILFTGYLLYSGFTSTGVNNAAHIGGFLSGLLIAKFLYKKPQSGNIF